VSLAAEASALLDEARAQARRRGHAEVTVDHLVLAALRRPPTMSLLARRAIDLLRLETNAEARLAAIAPVVGYRDIAPDPQLSRTLLDVVDAARRRRKVLFFQRPTRSIDLLDVAFASIEDATFDVSPIERLEEAARHIAIRNAHVNVLVDHAVIALVDEDPDFAEALRVLGHDPKSVRTRLERRLTRSLQSHLLSPIGKLIELAATHAYLARKGHDEMRLAPIVVELIRHPSVRRAVEEADVNRYDLLYAYVHHRAPPKDAAFRSEGTVDVVVHDDPYTTMELVVATLTADFGLSPAEAKKKMLAIHEEGKAVIATMPHDRAMACIIRAQGTARDELMPLRMEMVYSVAVSMTKR
jgi:ATP-dependent Clp protease adapter protein ClpS